MTRFLGIGHGGGGCGGEEAADERVYAEEGLGADDILDEVSNTAIRLCLGNVATLDDAEHLPMRLGINFLRDLGFGVSVVQFGCEDQCQEVADGEVVNFLYRMTVCTAGLNV